MVCAAHRLHAGRPQGHRGSTCRASVSPFSQHRALADLLHAEHYGDALIMPRTWKSALAPFLAGIPRRTGFLGEMAVRPHQRPARRREGAAPHGRSLRRASAARSTPPCRGICRYRSSWCRATPPRRGATGWALRPTAGRPPCGGSRRGRPVEAMARGLWGEACRTAGGRNWVSRCGSWAVRRDRRSPPISRAAHHGTRDLTGPDLRNAILALATQLPSRYRTIPACCMSPRRIGTPSIGIFGPTSPWHWAPLNPLAAVIETCPHDRRAGCRPCHKPTCRLLHHRCMRDIPPSAWWPRPWRRSRRRRHRRDLACTPPHARLPSRRRIPRPRPGG